MHYTPFIATTFAVLAAAAPVIETRASSDYSTVALEQHNVHRANHSASDLTYNSELAGYAATSAAACVFEETEVNGVYGQNIAFISPSVASNDALAFAITNQWYNGEVNYFADLYGQATPDMSDLLNCDHFTQIVWQATTSVGCATQVCAAGTLADAEASFTVCNYEAAGNVEGEYADNVKESLGEPTVTADLV